MQPCDKDKEKDSESSNAESEQPSTKWRVWWHDGQPIWEYDINNRRHIRVRIGKHSRGHLMELDLDLDYCPCPTSNSGKAE